MTKSIVAAPTLGRTEQTIAKVIIGAMVEDLKEVFESYGPKGAVGLYMTNKAPVLLGTDVVLPVVSDRYSTNDLMTIMLDPQLQTAIDKFQTELVLLPLSEQVVTLKKFVKIDWGAIVNRGNKNSTNGLENVLGFFHRNSQERAVAKLRLTELEYMLQHLPYLQQVLQLASVYAQVAVEADRLFNNEKDWLEKVSGADNTKIIEKLIGIRDQFADFEQKRVSSVDELSKLVPNLRQLICLTEMEAGKEDRSSAMALRVEKAILLKKKLEENRVSTMEAQQDLSQEVLLQQRLIQTCATQAAHIKKAVQLVVLQARAEIAFGTIMTYVHLAIQNASTALVSTIQRRIDETNRAALDGVLNFGLQTYNESMNEVKQLTGADVKQYLPEPEERIVAK